MSTVDWSVWKDRYHIEYFNHKYHNENSLIPHIFLVHRRLWISLWSAKMSEHITLNCIKTKSRQHDTESFSVLFGSESVAIGWQAQDEASKSLDRSWNTDQYPSCIDQHETSQESADIQDGKDFVQRKRKVVTPSSW